jgi:hypothetical protein
MRKFPAVLKHGARIDIPDGKGVTAAAVMLKKKDPDYRRMAAAI